MKAIIKSLLIVATALFVVGCGGGGTTGSVKEDSLFPTNSRLASPTDDNAQKVADLLFGYNTNRIVPANARKISDAKKFTIFNLLLNNVKEFNSNRDVSKHSRLTDESEYCDSGNLYKETLNDGSVEYRYNNCTQGDFTFNGTIKKHKYDNKLEVNYLTDFTIQDTNGDNIVVKKESSITLELLANGDYKTILNLVTNENGKSSGFENVVFILNIDTSTNSGTMYQTSGNIYINNLNEYVEWDSSYNMENTPLVYDNGTITDGEAHYIMRNATLAIYANGDGTATYDILSKFRYNRGSKII